MQRPAFTRGFTNGLTPSTPPSPPTPTVPTPTVPHMAKALHVKRVTLTSKKNWWMGEFWFFFLQVGSFFQPI